MYQNSKRTQILAFETLTSDKGVARGGAFKVTEREEDSEPLRNRLGRVAQPFTEEFLHFGWASESVVVANFVYRTHEFASQTLSSRLARSFWNWMFWKQIKTLQKQNPPIYGSIWENYKIWTLRFWFYQFSP